MNSAISLILMLSTFRNYWVEYVSCRLWPQFINGGGEDWPLLFQFLFLLYVIGSQYMGTKRSNKFDERKLWTSYEISAVLPRCAQHSQGREMESQFRSVLCWPITVRSRLSPNSSTASNVTLGKLTIPSGVPSKVAVAEIVRVDSSWVSWKQCKLSLQPQLTNEGDWWILLSSYSLRTLFNISSQYVSTKRSILNTMWGELRKAKTCGHVMQDLRLWSYVQHCQSICTPVLTSQLLTNDCAKPSIPV